ncbi:immunoglobulin superfamily member 10 isoform X1 [Ahaetulla prasina]|uniref:immunoglobulin superfamily member 10 isoform X1 n=2 Tax=Ahaetulla prasina TaxID=499056 RepID=UPI002649D3DA|nr:immunoglobulin superfamily member 10 isoform X1 [Ahaetulla prasina]
MVGLKLLPHKMQRERGNHPYAVGVLFGFLLAAFPGSSACPKLCACYVPTEVHCTFRYLTTIPLHISQHVERINLGYNNLVKLTETDFSGLEKLELLMLHSNQIHTIQDKTFSDLHLLKILKMSYNQIKVIQADTFHGLMTLVRLHLDHNKIEFVNPKAFYGLTSLKLVHLEGNLLKQLHPDTFVTLRYLKVFRTSAIKHIYLSDNFLTSLPQDIFSYMSELESLFLHGNPWTCDCAMKWFAKWAERHSDVIKCKKGKEATDALQCPLCTNPRNSKEKYLTKVPLPSFNCSKPSIDTDLKLKAVTMVDDGEFTSVSPKDFMAPIGSVSLNLIDQSGNQANIACIVQKPSKMSPVIFTKTDTNTLLEISLSTFLKCSIDHDHIHQLWSILALYSNSPLKLRREHLLTEMPSTGYKYKQIDSKNEELFTDIEAELTAEPPWLMQSQVSMQLDRTATTLNMLHIQYSIDAQIILPDDVPKPTKQMWVMILRDKNSKTEYLVLVNSSVELDCQAIGNPAPVTEWLLPDGTKVKAPYVSEDGKIVIEKSGKLLLHSADHFDTGLYHCIGTNYEDADVLTFRITVIDPSLKHNLLNGPQLSVFLGENIDLPCLSTGVPDASINWVIPGNMILHNSFKNKLLFHNGTLKIQPIAGQDNGHFMCITANKYGVDYLVYQVLVKRNLSKSQQLIKKDTQVDSEATEGSGDQGHDFIGQIKIFPSNGPAEVTSQASMQNSFTNYFIQNKTKNKYKEVYRINGGKISRRFRGQKRFGLSTKRINPLHWATFLEKTRNITLLKRQENITVKPTQKLFLSSGNEGEISGDDILAEEELMFLATRTPSKYNLREASGNVATAKLGSIPDNYSSFTTHITVTESESESESSATSSMVMQSEALTNQNWLNEPKPEMKVISLERYQTLPTPPTLMEVTMPSLLKEPNSAANNSNSQISVTSEEANIYFKSKPTVTPTMAITNNSQFIISHKTVEKPDLLAENAEKVSSHQVPSAAISLSNDTSQHGYIYRRKKITFQVSPVSAILAHQQIEVVKDSATHTPFPRWYSRRRKTFGRRRIIRPDRIPSNSGHRFAFPRSGFVPENSSLTLPAEISIPTPSNISVESFTPPTFIYTSIKPQYPKSTISSQTVISSSNKIDTDEVYEASTTTPFYSKSTQVAPQRKIKSDTHQAITDIDPSANQFTTNIHISKFNIKSTFTKANISPFMIKSTIPSFSIHDVSSSISNGEIASPNAFVTSYIQKELLQKQFIIQTKSSSEISVTDFRISGPTYKNSSIYETDVSKSDNQTDVPIGSIKHISENVSLLKDNLIVSLSTTESPSTGPMYNFTTDLNKETDTTTIQQIHNPTITVTNKISKLKTFRRHRKKGQRRRRPLQKSMPFHRNISIEEFVTPFKKIIPSTIMKTIKNVTVSPSLILTELFSKFTTMDLGTVTPQPPILSTADIKKDNTFLNTAQESLDNAFTIKPPMELTSEKLSSIAPHFEMSWNTTKISTALSYTSLVTTGPKFTKVAQTTREADKESYTYVGLTAAPKTQITKTALHVKNEINPQIPTNAIYMTTSPLLSKARLIQATQTTSFPRWGKISQQFPFSKIRDTGKPLIINTFTVLKSPQSSTLYTPLWKTDKNNYLRNWSERTDQVATSTNPEDLNSFYQTRLAKPRISGGKFAMFTVLANSDAFIPCEASGNPQPTIHWTKISAGADASKNRHGNRFKILPNGTLSIQNVNIQDRGQYLCVAANQQGSDKLLVTLSVVTYPPRIVGQSSKIITVHSGKPAVMKCASEGRPIPSITWVLANKTHISEFSIENEAVSLHSDGTLLIKKVSVYDRGIYTCTADNPVGSDTMAIRLQVIAAPPVILEDKKQLILETMGKSLTFPCTVKGDPHPTVHWVFPDETEVKPLHYVNDKVFLFPNGTLLVRNIVPSDSGKYECIATSSTGSERRVVLLQVEHRDIIPRISATSQRWTQLNFGNRLLLNCSAIGEPKPRIMWRLPSKAVVDQWHRMGSRIHVYPNGSLAVESITEKDAGDYICVARNRMGDDLTLLKVSVTMKPAKIDHKQYFKKLVPYGKDFKVDCKASGSPEPEISWSLPDGTTINNAMQADDSGHTLKKYTLFDNGTLYFNKVGMMEEGDYTCHAQNTLGKDEMKVQIKVVAAAPHIKQNLKAYTKIKAGDDAFFDCDAIGEPKPKIFWLLPSNNMIVASTQRYILYINGSLSIIKVRLLDAGEYICVARNSGGDDSKVYKVDVISKPPLINGLYSNRTVIKATAIKHSKKQIACSAEGDPVPQIMWIMPDNIFLTAPYYGSRVTIHKNGTLEIRNVRSSDKAEFICVARNDGGESMLVVHLEVLEILRRPVFRNPFNEKVIAKPGKTIFLNCSVDGNPHPEIIWILPNGTRFYVGIRTLRFYLGSNGTLVINRLSKKDAGKYRCTAKNQVGYIEKLIILETGETPTIFFHSGGAIKIMNGESLSLHCLAAGSPKPNIIWTLPSGFVLDRPQINGKYTLLENGTLFIREINIHDRGSYMCKAQNYIGDSTVVVFVTIVGHSPRITKRPPRNIHTVAGLAVQLHCMAFGIPDPEITWELPNDSLFFTGIKGQLSGSEILYPQGTLIIHNPNSSNSGIYKCVAKNQYGRDFTVTYVQVISNGNKV